MAMTGVNGVNKNNVPQKSALDNAAMALGVLAQVGNTAVGVQNAATGIQNANTSQQNAQTMNDQLNMLKGTNNMNTPPGNPQPYSFNNLNTNMNANPGQSGMTPTGSPFSFNNIGR